MTDFAELSLAPTSTHDDSAEDVVGFRGATLKSSSLKNPFKQGQLLPPFTATWESEVNEKRHSDDALMSRMKILLSCETHYDAFEEETRNVECDSALLLQLRINEPSVPDWRRKHAKVISNRSDNDSDSAGPSPPLFPESNGELKKGWALDSAQAWEAMTRRFQEKLKA